IAKFLVSTTSFKIREASLQDALKTSATKQTSARGYCPGSILDLSRRYVYLYFAGSLWLAIRMTGLSRPGLLRASSRHRIFILLTAKIARRPRRTPIKQRARRVAIGITGE